MTIRVHEFEAHCHASERNLLSLLRAHVNKPPRPTQVPVRFFVARSHPQISGFDCSIGVMEDDKGSTTPVVPSIFDCAPRTHVRSSSFNVVMIVPTGIGAEVGGHAGDATPAARLLGSLCDNLILHPNVVNSSALNEMPSNALYVEGSALTRLLMGTCGLQPVRSNRVLVVLDGCAQQEVLDVCVNMLSAARAVLGVELAYVLTPKDAPFRMRTGYTQLGVAVGEIEGLDSLLSVITPRMREFDAVAISSVIDGPGGYGAEYMVGLGEMVNPWGGVEAMLTHALSMLLGKPCAHAPLMETLAEAEAQFGIVDPRKASEAAVGDYTYCTVKGLAKAPRIVTGVGALMESGVLTASDVDCVVMPDGCLGLPTLACFEQGIPLILVDNHNWMQNKPSLLGPCIQVRNYMEAAGVVAALREGLSLESLRRPIEMTRRCR